MDIIMSKEMQRCAKLCRVLQSSKFCKVVQSCVKFFIFMQSCAKLCKVVQSCRKLFKKTALFIWRLLCQLNQNRMIPIDGVDHKSYPKGKTKCKFDCYQHLFNLKIICQRSLVVWLPDLIISYSNLLSEATKFPPITYSQT